MTAPARAVPAYQLLAEELRARIVRGELPPGLRLPSEAELCTAHGLSRSTVREALRVLASQQLVVTSRGVQGGTFVVRPKPERVSDFLETSLGLLAGADEVDVGDLLEARELLEVPAARLAAQRRSEADLADLAASLPRPRTRGSAAPVHSDSRFEGHRSFHEVVVRASGNPLLPVVTRPLFGVLRDRFLRDEAPASFWRRVDKDHVQIAGAVADADPDAAEQLMREHLGRLATTYRRIDRATRA